MILAIALFETPSLRNRRISSSLPSRRPVAAGCRHRHALVIRSVMFPTNPHPLCHMERATAANHSILSGSRGCLVRGVRRGVCPRHGVNRQPAHYQTLNPKPNQPPNPKPTLNPNPHTPKLKATIPNPNNSTQTHPIASTTKMPKITLKSTSHWRTPPPKVALTPRWRDGSDRAGRARGPASACAALPVQCIA